MNPMQVDVAEFNKTFGCEVGARDIGPYFTTPKNDDMRLRLITEEADELREAVQNGDMVATVDALGDILYVVFGACDVWNIDIQVVFDEIHRSNMSKLWCEADALVFHARHTDHTAIFVSPDNYVMKRPDGKVIKPSPEVDATMEWKRPYSKADLKEVVKKLRSPFHKGVAGGMLGGGGTIVCSCGAVGVSQGEASLGQNTSRWYCKNGHDRHQD